MRVNSFFGLALACVVGISTACGGGGAATPDRREFPLKGQILSIAPDHKEASVKHDEIEGFMPAMTMPYKVRDAKEYESLKPGALISATLVIVSNDAYLKDVKQVGEAPLEPPPAEAPSARSGFELLKDGELAPDAAFIDQDGRKRDIASFKGSALVVTFIYTKCPIPTFCPLMDRHFVSIQAKLKSDPALNAKLLSVSFDPIVDTPVVLKAHARELGADPKIWSFFTGDRDEIDRFAARFGVSVTRAQYDQRDITHNLRTAIIDREGRLVKTYTGNEWTPEQIVADLR
jgi:protein SCO1/2